MSAAADGLLRIDWEPLLARLLARDGSAAELAWLFHDSLALTIRALVLRIAGERNVDGVGLTGGVFQNRLLAELVCDKLSGTGYPVAQSAAAPCNDAGLSYGQVIEFRAHQLRHAR
jgi:hydrogenase maturation protein HypF